ncbi:MAG: PDZ domain-containing protein, partial [Kofleriaceae bacterium]
APVAPAPTPAAPAPTPVAPALTPTAPYPAPISAAVDALPPSPPSAPPLTAATAESPSAVQTTTAAPPPASRAASPDTRSLNAAIPDHPARGKHPAAAKAKPARRTAAGKQTDDALALADVLSGDRSTRSPRGPSAEALPAEPYPAATRASEPRTAPPAGAIQLSRGEVDRALADFAKLTAAIHARFSDTGVRVDDVTAGTIFERAGLRPGDTITAIDGTRLRSLDDAANLYARASTARALTVQLVRDGKPVSLHVVIQ